MSKTHRCEGCDQSVEHDEAELCPSCGRCTKHCRADTHDHMERINA